MVAAAELALQRQVAARARRVLAWPSGRRVVARALSRNGMASQRSG